MEGLWSRRPPMNGTDTAACPPRLPWNTGKITGPKPPLRPGHVWAIRAKLHLEKHARLGHVQSCH
jgi:hypothetical protein